MPEPQRGQGEVAIRHYRSADQAPLIELWRRCGLLVSYNDPERDIALWEASVNAAIFVGERDGRIVASVCVGHDGHRGYPYYVAVDPDLRGSGIGRRMMRHAEAWLAELGVPKMNVMVRETNAVARGFYSAIGYEDTPRFVFGRWLTPDARPPAPADRRSAELDCVVTYLEMTQRPTKPPVPVPHRQQVALLRARRPSAAFYRFLYNTVGERWLWYERRVLDDAALLEIVQDEAVEIYVLYVDGAPAGFAELDRRQPADVELAYVGLMPDFIGRGWGAYLLSSAVEIAWGRELARLWVHTNTLDHPKALALYQRVGFVPYKQERKSFPDPRLRGLIPPSPAASQG